MVQNFYGTTYSLDVGCKEYAYWGEFADRDGNAWPAYQHARGHHYRRRHGMPPNPPGKMLSAFQPKTCSATPSCRPVPTTEGGGVHWAAGNYAGGGWETGVEETMDKHRRATSNPSPRDQERLSPARPGPPLPGTNSPT